MTINIVPLLLALQLATVLTMEAASIQEQAQELLVVYRQNLQSAQQVVGTVEPYFNDSQDSASGTADCEDDKVETVNSTAEHDLELNNQILSPEVIEMILWNIGDLVSINDYIIACQDYRREYSGWFAELARQLYPQFLMQAVRSYGTYTEAFGGPWEGRRREELFSLICKVVLLLPDGVDGERLFPRNDQKSLSSLIRLLSSISMYHKFDSVQQHVKFFKSFHVQPIFPCAIRPLRNVHFSYPDSFKALIGFYQWKFDMPDLMSNILFLIFKTFTDEEERREQICNIVPTGCMTLVEFISAIAKPTTYRTVVELEITQGDVFFETVLSIVAAREDQKVFSILAQTIIHCIINGYGRNIPKEMCGAVVRRLLRNGVTDGEAAKVFECLLKNGYDMNMIKQDIEEFVACNEY